MTSAGRSSADPDEWGIVASWVDAYDRRQQVSGESVRRLRGLVGHPPHDLDERAPLVSRPGHDLGVGAVDIALEGGGVVRVEGRLPPDFPLGYHTMRDPTGLERLLAVSPGCCFVPARRWGWSVQLYSVRSHGSWGIGDLADLRGIREWAQRCGAGFLMVSPLHATAPTLPQQASPYLPVTRSHRNPIYLRIEEVPGADGADLSDLRSGAAALNASASIDRDAVWRLKSAALERIFVRRPENADFITWRRRQSWGLEQFGIWCTLAQRFGSDWHTWPALLQHPQSAEVAQLAAEAAERVTFHIWLQWLLDGQLKAACGEMLVIQDLPVGVDAGGADTWAERGAFVDGARIGAPPDFFNAHGQEWGAPPVNPWQLRAEGYRPFLDALRSTLGGGGVRIDHVLGLFRQWYVPANASPVDGAYVRFPSADLLDLVALESARASAVVVGEDLGTVESGVRLALADHAVLSYRLLWFENEPPPQWPAHSLAAVTTHDLPTVAGLLTGSDVVDQRRYVVDPDGQLDHGRRQLLDRLIKRGGPPCGASVEEAVMSAYSLLAQAPSTLLSATLEDAVAAEFRPNMPGITDRPNWCVPLPVPLEELVEHPLAQQLAALLDDAVRRKLR